VSTQKGMIFVSWQ